MTAAILSSAILSISSVRPGVEMTMTVKVALLVSITAALSAVTPRQIPVERADTVMSSLSLVEMSAQVTLTVARLRHATQAQHSVSLALVVMMRLLESSQVSLTAPLRRRRASPLFP
jgi:hypothetical protein